jgi:hypothetical protein
LSVATAADIEAIGDYGIATFGLAQAQPSAHATSRRLESQYSFRNVIPVQARPGHLTAQVLRIAWFPACTANDVEGGVLAELTPPFLRLWWHWNQQ